MSQPGDGGGGGEHFPTPPTFEPPDTLSKISQERLELQTWNFTKI